MNDETTNPIEQLYRSVLARALEDLLPQARAIGTAPLTLFLTVSVENSDTDEIYADVTDLIEYPA